jgi:thioester reductase-like protein
MPPTGLLLTGGTGFVGAQLLARYLDRTDRRVYALVRAEDEAAARKRLCDKLSVLIDPSAHLDRLVAVPGDVQWPGLRLPDEHRERLVDDVGTIVHAAASVSFELPLEDSRRINVEGTRHVLDFARECTGLERFAYVSTAYVAGDHPGEFGEDDLQVGQGFRNPYERSKFEAEQLVREQAGGLPVQIFRPSIIVGEAESGWTDSFNVLYTPIKAYVRGQLPVLPARQKAPVDVVPVDYVADAIFELTPRPVEGIETHHLVAGPQATTVKELVGLTSEALERPVPLILPPWLYRLLLHRPLLWLGNKRRRRGLRRMEAFFPYLGMRVRYRNERTRRLLEPEGIAVSPIRSYFGRLLDFAQRAGWGKRRLAKEDTRTQAPA